MKYVTQIADHDALINFVTHELKTNGIKVPKMRKTSEKQDKKLMGKVFGTAINHLPSEVVDEEKRIKIPTFLVRIFAVLENEIKAEGLFRKAGSVARQREMRKKIENGDADFLSLPVYDLACLVKQFLRELPEPIIWTRLHECFLKAQSLDSRQKRLDSLMLLCLLLPVENINLLRYIMIFLSRTAAFSDTNKMDINNLSLIMTPNLMQCNDKTLQKQTEIISTIMRNADEIGFVPTTILDKINPSGACSEDELENCHLPFGDSVTKKKRRSSINGVFSSLRKRVGQRPAVSENKEASSIPLSVFHPMTCDSPIRNVERHRGLERNSSKRKADTQSPDNTPPTKKRAIFTESCCEMSFRTPTNHIGYQKCSQSYLDAVQASGKIQFAVGTPRLNFADSNQINTVFNSSEKPSKDHFKTPKSKPKYKRFLSPGKLMKRNNNVVNSSNSRKQNDTKQEKNKDSGSKKGKEKKKFVDESLTPICSTRSNAKSTFKSCISQTSSFESNVAFSTDGPDEPKEEFMYNLRSRRSLTDSDLSKRLTESLQIKQPNSKTDEDEKNCGRGNPLTHSQSMKPMNMSLRRGRPNTVRTGLPVTSPFKVSNGASVETGKMKMTLTPIAFELSQEMTEEKWEEREIAQETEKKRSNAVSFEPIIVVSDTTVATAKNFIEEFQYDDSISVDGLDSTPNLDLDFENEQDPDEDMGKLFLSDDELESDDKENDENFNVSKLRENNFENIKAEEMETLIADVKKTEQTIRNVRRRSLRSSSESRQNSTRQNNTTSVVRRPSSSELKNHKAAVIAPLTNKTFNILSSAGIVRCKEEEDNEDEGLLGEGSQEPEPVLWRSAKAVINDAEDIAIINCSRPSLVILKKERAGMVSANIQKYNAIAQKQENEAAISPVKTKFVRSAPRKSMELKRINEANLPLTNYVRRQSFRNAKRLNRSNSFAANSSCLAETSLERTPVLGSVSSASDIEKKKLPLRPKNGETPKRQSQSSLSKTSIFKRPSTVKTPQLRLTKSLSKTSGKVKTQTARRCSPRFNSTPTSICGRDLHH